VRMTFGRNFLPDQVAAGIPDVHWRIINLFDWSVTVEPLFCKERGGQNYRRMEGRQQIHGAFPMRACYWLG
jgi:hypothetical protein